MPPPPTELQEANEELQAQLLTTGLQEGRQLLDSGAKSLAAELGTCQAIRYGRPALAIVAPPSHTERDCAATLCRDNSFLTYSELFSHDSSPICSFAPHFSLV